MEVKKGYKLTEVGMIPEDWDVLELGEMVSYTKGFAFKSIDYQSDGIRIIRVSDTTYTSIKDESAVFIDANKALEYAKWKLKEDDLIISTVGSKPPMWNSLVGKVIRIDKKYAGSLLNQNAVRIRARNNKPFTQYLLLNNLRMERYIRHIQDIFRGNANQASITLDELFKFQVAIPPTLAEQQAIAEALSDADALIESLEHLLAKKRQIKQGAMQELLTGRRRLEGFVGEWEEKTIGSFSDVKTGPFGSALHERDYVSHGTPLITVEHLSEYGLVHSNMSLVSDADVQRLKAYTVQENDILFSRVGVVDRNSLIKKEEEGWMFSGSILRLRIINKDVYAPFISYFFYGESFRNYIVSMAVGQTRLSLNTKIISETPITIPSFPEQTAIADILSDMDAEIAALEAKLVKARQVKQGMMQELLTGRVRVG